MKQIRILLVALLGLFSFGNMSNLVQAEEVAYVDESAIIVEPTSPIVKGGKREERIPNVVYSYKKANVRKWQEWSNYRRISDNLVTGPAGGSISANQTTTFSASVAGDIRGLNIKVGGSVSSARGYRANVAPNSRVYLGYRVRYAVETGTRYIYKNGSILVGKNTYTIKIPLYGEYKLIRY